MQAGTSSERSTVHLARQERNMKTIDCRTVFLDLNIINFYCNLKPGLILMIISGLHIGWGIWRTTFLDLWSETTSSSLLTFIIMAFSLGAFVGGFVGSVLTPILRKNSIYVSFE